MTAFADSRAFIRLPLSAAGLLVALALLLAPALGPEPAIAQTGCAPAGDDTFVPGEPGEPPPGGVVVDPGDPCPETEPVPPPVAEELPPPPRCDPCPKRDEGSTESTGTGSTPAPIPSVQRLPFTGLDKERTTLVLSGFGLLAIGLGLAVRRRAVRT